MMPYRQTRLPQLPRLIYAKSAQWIKKSTPGEWNCHYVTTRTSLGAGGGHGPVSVGSAFGRPLSSVDLAKQDQTGVEENSLCKPNCKLIAKHCSAFKVQYFNVQR